ncbi:SBBP repeat-containing protein [Tunturiibacter empetritectus]|uniref:SBBP repeat-containing protein n=1 Tax=Tunturiibacter empetritectus TaxID=3069691 RepID=UPI003D9B3861
MIDPTISFVTFLGGSDTDTASAVAVDGLGDTYVTGQTYSGNFNVVGGIIQGSRSGDSDAFVTKLGTHGNILFSTYLGGGDNDAGNGIAVDASGVYVGGQTRSDDFPLRQPFQFEKRVTLPSLLPSYRRRATGSFTRPTSAAPTARTAERSPLMRLNRPMWRDSRRRRTFQL